MDFVCSHLGSEKKKKRTKELISFLFCFFRALKEASTGPWTRFSLSVFECTGCQGRCLRYTHFSHTHTD
jgi:hypothetical protein